MSHSVELKTLGQISLLETSSRLPQTETENPAVKFWNSYWTEAYLKSNHIHATSETQGFQENLHADGNRAGYIEREEWYKEEFLQMRSKPEENGIP